MSLKRLFSILLVSISLGACAKKQPTVFNSGPLETFSIHDVELSDEVIDEEELYGIWEADTQEIDGVQIADRIRLSENILLLSRKCLFDNGVELLTEVYVVIRREGGQIFPMEPLVGDTEEGPHRCSVGSSEYNISASSVDPAIISWNQNLENFKKIQN